MGHGVTVGVDFASGLAAAQSSRPELLVADVLLPDRPGPDLAAALRERWPDLPTVFISGYTEEQRPTDGPVPGAVFLRKPFRGAALARAIGTALERSEGADGAAGHPPPAAAQRD